MGSNKGENMIRLLVVDDHELVRAGTGLPAWGRWLEFRSRRVPTLLFSYKLLGEVRLIISGGLALTDRLDM